MSSYGVTSIQDMREAFPLKPPQGEGKPDLHFLLNPCLRHLCECAISNRTAGLPLGKLYLVIRAPSYALHTADAYPQRTPNPGDTETYTQGMDAAQRGNTKNAFAVNYKRHHDENNMDQALIERFLQMIDSDYAQALRDATCHLANPTFLTMFDQAIAMWGRTTPEARNANRARLTEPWNAADGVNRLWRHLRDRANYALFSRNPIPDSQLVDAALTSIKRTGAYRQAYLDFKREADQSFGALKTFFIDREADREEVDDTEAGERGYGMGAMSDETDDQSTQIFRQTLTDFAASMASNERNFTEQANAATATQQQLVAAVQQMQQNISQLGTQLQMAQAARQMQAQGPPPPFQAQQPPRQPQLQFQQQPQQQPYVQPPIQQPIQQPPFQQNQQQAQMLQPYPQRPINKVKRFENWNYCHTHGHDLPQWHHSGTCLQPGWNHQWNATRQNTMGGSRKNAHRDILPSTMGRTSMDAGGRGGGRGRGGRGGRGGGGRGRGRGQPYQPYYNQQQGGYGGYGANPQGGYQQNYF